MKPQPQPNVPGNTEAERLDNAVGKMFSVSKAEAKEKRAWDKKRAAKKP